MKQLSLGIWIAWALVAATSPAEAVSVPAAAWLFDEAAGTSAAPFAGPDSALLVGGVAHDTGTPFSYGGNRALLLDGVDDNLQVATNLLSSRSSFTYSAWIQLAAGDDNLFGSSTTGDFYFYVNANRGLTYSDSTGLSTADGLVTLGAWTHVAFVKSGATERIYVGGIERASRTDGPAATRAMGGELYLGRWFGGGYFLEGRMDEVAFWYSALDATEIGSLSQSSLHDVPEPGSVALGAAALAGGAMTRRRRMGSGRSES